MTPFATLTSAARLLPRDHVDTDAITRIDRLVMVPRKDLGRYAFETLRTDPDCPLNAPGADKAQILITGRNFGCGSSRESAVWALAGSGLRAVIARSFGDIFRSNCLRNGVLPIALPDAHHDTLMAHASGEITIDLPAQTITPSSGGPIPFDIDPGEKDSLVTGMDDLARTMARRDEIRAHMDAEAARRPWTLIPPAALAAFETQDKTK